MLRFQPDDWLEVLLRPFILVDPYGFIHLEVPAPDLRFAVLALLTAAALASSRVRSRLAGPGWRTLVGLWLAFYAWTFGIGNGRYFIAGMLIVGPVIVLLVGALPLTRSMRVLMLAGVMGLQGLLLQLHFNHGLWALTYWRDSPGVSVGETPLRREPAVFITTSSISHSILVPQFHPDSRWVNLAGQVDIALGMLEYPKLHELLATPLPRYLVVPSAARQSKAVSEQPTAAALAYTMRTLARHGLDRDGQACTELRTGLDAPDLANPGGPPLYLAYWVCPLKRDTPPQLRVEPPAAHPLDDVFEAIEQRCPRYFPPGSSRTRTLDGIAARRYNETDATLLIDVSDTVYLRVLRALNPTRIATVDQIRSRDFELDCGKLPGRYVYPWQR